MSYYERVKHIIVEHRGALVGALAAAVLVFSPLVGFLFLADSYQGINVGNFQQDEFHYLAKGREVLDGNGLGNIILREGKDWYNPEQKYAEYIVLPLRWLRLSQKVNIATVFTAVGFVGVFALVLLIYSFLLQLSRDKRLALLSALFVVLAYNVVTKYNFIDYFNVYGRPVIPLASSLVFFFYLNLLVKSLKSMKRVYVFGAAAAFGLSFYIYLFCWSFILALNVILAAIYLLKKEQLQFKKVLVISSLGLLVGSFELLLLYFYAQSDMGRQIVAFGGGAFSREFTLIKISWLALAFFLFYYLPRNKSDENWPILLALILAGIVTINQQIITGRQFQSFHYFWNFIIPTISAVGLYMVWSVVVSPALRRALFYTLLALIFVNSATQSYLGTLSTLPLKNYAQNYRPIIDYLNRDQDPSVILASDPFYELLFIVYTPHDLFWHGMALAFNTPGSAIRDAFIAYRSLNKSLRAEPLDYAGSNAQPPGQYKELYISFKHYIVTILGKDEDAFYRALAAPEDVADILKRHKVKYVVWDKNRNPEWDLSILRGLREVLAYRNIYVYLIQ